MRFKEFGLRKNKTIVLIHGVGISWKMWTEQINSFSNYYHIIVPILDGHDDENNSEFTSVKDSAEEIIKYIKKTRDGHVYAILGESLGGMITAEILCKKDNICEKALINAAPLVPFGKLLTKFSIWYKVNYNIPLMAKGSKLMRKACHFYPDYLFDEVSKICSRMSKSSCTRAYTDACTYKISNSIKNTKSKIVYWYGSNEALLTKRSATYLLNLVPDTEIEVLEGYEHGQLCLGNPKLYIEKVNKLLS